MADNNETDRSFIRIVVPPAVVIVFAVLIAMFYQNAGNDEWVDGETGATPAPYDTGEFETIDADREILLHCGNSMRPAAEALAAEFQRRRGIAVRLNFGGSSELLSSIEMAEIGDLYLPHDPYAEILKEKGLLDRYEVVGHLAPIIIVPKGNPKNIETMRDLATRDIKIALPDSRYATAGRLVNAAFREMGLLDELAAKVEMEGRGHNDVALALVNGYVDAAMVWNFIAAFYEDSVDMIVPPDVEFPETRVTLCLLTTAEDVEAAEKFMELAVSDFGREVFEKHGYSK